MSHGHGVAIKRATAIDTAVRAARRVFVCFPSSGNASVVFQIGCADLAVFNLNLKRTPNSAAKFAIVLCAALTLWFGICPGKLTAYGEQATASIHHAAAEVTSPR